MSIVSFLFRYGDVWSNVWSDWRTTSEFDAGKEETLEVEFNEEIASIAGYSWDNIGDTESLQAETSAGRSWGPHGEHKSESWNSLRPSPATSNGLRLNHISGDQNKYILRWLHQYNQMKT